MSCSEGTAPVYRFARGATIRVGLLCVDGDVDDVEDLVAIMVRTLPGTYEPDPDGEEIELAASPRPASGDLPAGFFLSYTVGDVIPGRYVVDARFMVSAEPYVTTPAIIEIQDSVSG